MRAASCPPWCRGHEAGEVAAHARHGALIHESVLRMVALPGGRYMVTVTAMWVEDRGQTPRSPRLLISVTGPEPEGLLVSAPEALRQARVFDATGARRAGDLVREVTGQMTALPALPAGLGEEASCGR